LAAAGKPTYDVIDGKQRLESILLYMGKGRLAKIEEGALRSNLVRR